MAVRLLPCATRACGGPAIVNDGSPYILGRAPSHFPFRYKCAHCKRTTSITVEEWNRLPALTVDDLRHLPGPGGHGEMDLSHRLLRDFTGHLSDAQIAEVIAADPPAHLLLGRG